MNSNSPAIFVGGTASQTDLMISGAPQSNAAVVARINLSENLYQFRKLYSTPDHSALIVVTALAVDPAGTKVAVHAGEMSQSVVDERNSDKRKYYGS